MSGFLKGDKRKLLYLLALFQLVAGPLVLLQVTVLCKVTAREAPRQGMAAAFEKAWQSREFHATLQLAEQTGKNDSKSPLPASDPLGKLLKAKSPIIAWETVRFVMNANGQLVPCSDWARRWTPIWPQAPPGPPPRIG